MEYRENLLKAIASIACTAGDGTLLAYGDAVNRVVTGLNDLRCAGKKLCFIGNGGSAAIAIHMTGDFFSNGKVITHSMHDPATLTCLANDFGYEQVFSKQLAGVATPGDMLIAISSSGKSPNILKAVEAAQSNECQILTLSGFAADNPLRSMGDWNFYVPCSEYGKVETIHNMILQEIVDKLMLV